MLSAEQRPFFTKSRRSHAVLNKPRALLRTALLRTALLRTALLRTALASLKGNPKN
jgi:hypothetical protein